MVPIEKPTNNPQEWSPEVSSTVYTNFEMLRIGNGLEIRLRSRPPRQPNPRPNQRGITAPQRLVPATDYREP